ncbi:hypothetical protein QEN19_001203 [Hanseniaspora menglaensis]
MNSIFSQVNEGNSNILLSKDGNEQSLFRLCKRKQSLRLNNKYVGQNIKFHQEVKNHYEFIGSYLQNEQLLLICKSNMTKEFDDLAEFLIKNKVKIDDDHISLVQIENCLAQGVSKIGVIDYYSKIYNNRILECKPKWNKMSLLNYMTYISFEGFGHEASDMNKVICRNCLNSKTNIKKKFILCYNGCMGLQPIDGYPELKNYILTPSNIITKIYEQQTQLQDQIVYNDESTLFLINLLIALRDITLFIDIDKKKITIIDLDYKNIENKDDFDFKMSKEWILLQKFTPNI